MNNKNIDNSDMELHKKIHIVTNPFTLRAPLESSVCYSHTFENN